jgi:hypothetical protein
MALVMKISTWGIAHNMQTWILVGLGIVMFGAIVWDVVTTKN